MGASYSGVEAHGGGTASSATIVTGSATWTAGREVIAIMDFDITGTVSSMTQSGGAITWTEAIAKFTDARHDQSMTLWRGVIVTGFTGTITANLAVSMPFRDIAVAEVSDAHLTQYDDTDTDVVDVGPAVDLGLTTTQTDCLVVASFSRDGGTGTWTSNPANMTTISNFLAAVECCMNYRTVNPGAGATTVDFTLTDASDGVGCGVAVAPQAGVSEPAQVYPFAISQRVG